VKKVLGILIVLGLLMGLVLFFNKTPKVEEIVIQEKVVQKYEVIGNSIEGRPIEVYRYGNGEKHLLFVGGIHGGYEWNSVLLAYEFIDYLDINPDIIPENITLEIIPSANPDGVYKVTQKEGRFKVSDVSKDAEVLASGRFNANNVDLNRNFDCKWQSKSTWRSKEVNAGREVFSESESKTLRDFILKVKPLGVVLWHSQANAVYASQCEEGILPKTLDMLNAYSKGSDYKAIETFDAYVVTGAVEDWLASINIPAITVELKTHEVIEFEKNLGGTKELLKLYSKKGE